MNEKMKGSYSILFSSGIERQRNEKMKHVQPKVDSLSCRESFSISRNVHIYSIHRVPSKEVMWQVLFYIQMMKLRFREVMRLNKVMHVGNSRGRRESQPGSRVCAWNHHMAARPTCHFEWLRDPCLWKLLSITGWKRCLPWPLPPLAKNTFTHKVGLTRSHKYRPEWRTVLCKTTQWSQSHEIISILLWKFSYSKV